MKGEVWMKNTTLTLTFNTERLDALTYHMGKKEADLKEELSDYLQKMYEKYVPQATREYLDDKIARDGAAKPARPRRQVEESHMRNLTSQEMGQAGSV